MNKKYATNYFSWAFHLLFVVGGLYVFGYVTSEGMVYEYKNSYDLTGHFLVIIGLVFIGLELWEIVVLFNFLAYDINGSLQVHDHKLVILKTSEQKTYDLRDLTDIEQVQGKWGRKSITSQLSYSRLVFKNHDVIVVTSFTIYNHELINY